MEKRDPSSALRLLWGMEAAGTRGPKRGLSLEGIVDAAIAVADADGYAALSMKRVAEELGFTAMSLYRYVDSKTTLVELMSDRVIGLPPDSDPALGWRDALRRWAVSEYELIIRHPWWLEIPMVTPPLGPNNMAWLNSGLTILERTGLPAGVRLRLVMNLTLFVIGRMRLSVELGQADTEDDTFDGLFATMDPRRFPAVLAAAAEGAFSDDEIDWARADFEFGLDRTLDGYEHFIRGLRP
ncbi:TetR/AcrR family transcriptional regulator [Nocardia asteroides]|uniref:TetR/AcrR family transcriptional regulator n=1 Tax=Nocardia asteroides TaxID=1824 RepID=UPI001E45FCF6|nr:TetR/AcrR family transcriptional regulator [Nocardia asteroides]UGT60361.1 TetR/AcrR family transcriptional regulator [Nocardia asteroides]